MTRRPEDVTLSATAGCVMLATGAAFVLIMYAMLAFLDILPASLATQGLAGLAN